MRIGSMIIELCEFKEKKKKKKDMNKMKLWPKVVLEENICYTA